MNWKNFKTWLDKSIVESGEGLVVKIRSEKQNRYGELSAITLTNFCDSLEATLDNNNTYHLFPNFASDKSFRNIFEYQGCYFGKKTNQEKVNEVEYNSLEKLFEEWKLTQNIGNNNKNLTWGNFTVKAFSPKVFMGAGGINCVLIFTLDSAINYENNERSNEIRIRFEEGIVNKGELERMGKALLGKEILVGNLEIIKNCSSSAIFTAEGMKLKSAEDYRKLIRELVEENVETNFGTIQNLAEVWKIKKYKLYTYNMTEKRTIILIGSTGNGKSTIANVISDTNSFKESEEGVSETRNIDIKIFRIEGEDTEYRIIDTIGIGDTRFNEREVLVRIAEAADAIKEGLSQILFVTSGRFTKEEIKAYTLLRKVIFAEDMGKYTTIIRTKFPSFRRVEKCKSDKEKMIAENEDIADIINSSKSFIHVNNLTEEEEPSLASRKECRDILRMHLMVNCKEIYKPKNLDDLNNRTRNHIDERERMEKEMKEIREEKRRSEQRYEEALKNSDENARKREEKIQADFQKQLSELDNRRVKENENVSRVMTEQMNSKLSAIERREGEMVNQLKGTIDYLKGELGAKDKNYKEAMEREYKRMQARIEQLERPPSPDGDCKIM